MGPHKNLTVWKKSKELVKLIYQATAKYPKSELFGLVSQMRRCAVSVPSNIAEGYGRGSNTDLVHFLRFARGSVNEPRPSGTPSKIEGELAPRGTKVPQT